MSLEITGKLIQKLAVQQGVSKTGNNWMKQEFVIETQEQYPRKICANLWGDKTDMLNQFAEGQLVKVSFDLESREFNGKWYTDVKAWKLEPAADPDHAGGLHADHSPSGSASSHPARIHPQRSRQHLA